MENIQQNQNIPQTNAEDEIDLIALVKTLWNGRKTLIRSVIICAILGLAVGFLSPKEYSASTIVVPQTGKMNNRLGGISSLAAMAGFNLNLDNQNNVLSPMVYPQIVNSVPFQLELMNIPFTFEKVDHPVSLYTYYTEYSKPNALSVIKKYTIGLPFLLLRSINQLEKKQQDTLKRATEPISITKKQQMVRKRIKSALSLDVNIKEGYITLTANMPEAVLSAEVAHQSRELLQKYITQLKVEKASEQLSFIHDRYNEKEKEFEQAQKNLALFRDQNKNVATAMAKTEEERLQSEYSIAFSVYSELAKQLEQAQIQVKEETPVFSVLSPTVVPKLKSKPQKVKILAIWLFLGGVIGTGIVFGRQYMGTFKERWKESDEK